MTTTDGPLALPLPDEGTQLASTSESGEKNPSNLLTEIAGIIAANAQSAFERQVAHHMKTIGESHHQTEYHDAGVCAECGLGDTPWPCWTWLQAMYTGVEWLYLKAGVCPAAHS